MKSIAWSSLKAQGEPNYIEGLLEGGLDGDGAEGAGSVTGIGGDAESDPMYDQACEVVLKHRRASISLVQRHLRIGYNRAARLLEQMEQSGMVSAMQSNGNRDILVPAAAERKHDEDVPGLAAAAACAWLRSWHPRPPRPPARRKLRDFVGKVNGATGSFSQYTVNAQGRTQPAQTGTFSFQRPGKFKWAVQKPYEQLVISDGAKVYQYDPDLLQVTERKVDAAIGTSPAAILFGSGSLEQSFEVSALPSRTAWTGCAQAAQRRRRFSRVDIGLKDNLPARVELLDSFGQTTRVDLSGITPNPSIGAKEFQFTAPKGVDVVKMSRFSAATITDSPAKNRGAVFRATQKRSTKFALTPCCWAPEASMPLGQADRGVPGYVHVHARLDQRGIPGDGHARHGVGIARAERLRGRWRDIAEGVAPARCRARWLPAAQLEPGRRAQSQCRVGRVRVLAVGLQRAAAPRPCPGSRRPG